MANSEEYRAGKLAALTQLDLALPATVRAAITGYEAVMGLAVPNPPYPGADRRAITALADELARDALTGQHPAPPAQPLDVTPVTRARQDDQAALDRAALARELRAAAAVVLCQVFSGDNGQQVIAAIQTRHQAIVADLAKRAKRLPPGASDVTALEQGGQHRADFLAARDAVAELDRLREAMRLADHGTPPVPDDGVSMCVGWERTGALAGTWLAPAGVTTHGPLGSLEFYLSAARVPEYDLWLPSSGEQADRLGALRADRQEKRARAAAL